MRTSPSCASETHRRPWPVEQEAPSEAAPLGGDGRVGVVEQPFVGAEGLVEPHAVVQAGAHEFGVVPARLVWGEDGVEERHVGRVGRHAGVEERVVGELAVRPDPQALIGLSHLTGVPREVADVALVDGVGPVEPLLQLVLPGLEALEEGGQGLGLGHVGHGDLVLQALLEVVEGGRQVEDRPPVLHGDDTPGREGASVSDPVDLVEDRHLRVTGSEEIGVQRMHPPVLDGAARRHERLCGHLAAEDALAFLVGLDAPEDVHLNGLEVKQVDEELQGRAHRAHVRRRPTGPWQSTPPPPQLPCGGVTAAEAGRRARIPTGLHLGRGHGGPPDRGWQRQQRLVGLGARPGVGHARAER